MHTITLVPGDLSLTRPARWLAALFQQAVVFRALGAIAEIEVRGGEQLGKIRTPCVFVANHSSHLDTLCIMRALPWSLRLRIAVPAAADYWFRNPLVGALASLLFNLVPLRRAGCPFGDLKRAGKLLENGWSLIIFPEGTRSPTGRMGAFKAGAALLAVRLGAPIVPIKIEGAYEILRKGQALPHRGRIVVKIGEAVQVDQHADYREAIRVVEDRVRVL